MKKSAKNENETELELEVEYAVIDLPKNTIEANIEAMVYCDNGRIVEVKNKLNFQNVRSAFRKAEEGYIPADPEFVLTEKGKQIVEKLENAGVL